MSFCCKPRLLKTRCLPPVNAETRRTSLPRKKAPPRERSCNLRILWSPHSGAMNYAGDRSSPTCGTRESIKRMVLPALPGYLSLLPSSSAGRALPLEGGWRGVGCTEPKNARAAGVPLGLALSGRNEVCSV